MGSNKSKEASANTPKDQPKRDSNSGFEDEQKKLTVATDQQGEIAKNTSSCCGSKTEQKTAPEDLGEVLEERGTIY